MTGDTTSDTATARGTAATALFVALGLATLLPWVTPGLALAVGAALGLTGLNPSPPWTTSASKRLLKASVVGLGFGLSLPAVLEVGRRGVWITALGITLTLGAGLLLARWLRVERTTGTLISGGTAICGGSAIAALAPVIGAGAEAISVSLATVFVLNGVALYLFPVVGDVLGMTQGQFAVWSAIAIHDTSSVVGAAATFGEEALAEATVLKLTRALWIVPLALGAAAWRRRTSPDTTGHVSIPWFIALFALASAVRALYPDGLPVYEVIVDGARRGLVLTLFLIGAGLTRATLREVGVRPLVHGVTLWVLVGTTSLAAVLALA